MIKELENSMLISAEKLKALQDEDARLKTITTLVLQDGQKPGATKFVIICCKRFDLYYFAAKFAMEALTFFLQIKCDRIEICE